VFGFQNGQESSFANATDRFTGLAQSLREPCVALSSTSYAIQARCVGTKVISHSIEDLRFRNQNITFGKNRITYRKLCMMWNSSTGYNYCSQTYIIHALCHTSACSLTLCGYNSFIEEKCSWKVASQIVNSHWERSILLMSLSKQMLQGDYCLLGLTRQTQKNVRMNHVNCQNKYIKYTELLHKINFKLY
jgi:hypothetical protein